MKICICDKCGNEIRIHIQEKGIDRDTDGKDITEQFFSCPECGAHYTVFIYDAYMRRRIAARKRLTKKYYNRELSEQLMEEMWEHLKELKARYGIG